MKHKPSYISKDDFISAATACNFDSKAIVDYVIENGIADTYDISSANRRLRSYREKGLLPLESGNKVPTDMLVKKVSTYYGKDGDVRGQWVSAERDTDQMLSALDAAITTLTEKIKPLPPTPTPSAMLWDDVLSVYTIGDAHIGMLSHAPEAGEDHDLEISQTRHVKAMDMLVSQSNPTEEAFIVDVGDFLHSDNADNRTSSGNPLDVDGRYHKVLEVALYLTIRLIQAALLKHKIVHWRSAIGNHNGHSAIMMNQFINAYFRNEPRVIVHTSPAAFFYHQFGKNLIGITHGHTAKAEKLPGIMATDVPKLWGDATFRYFYCGHIHHDTIREFPGCKVETFRTLASKDAWHASMGYRSGQDMKCISLHKDYGEISRNTVNIAMLDI